MRLVPYRKEECGYILQSKAVVEVDELEVLKLSWEKLPIVLFVHSMPPNVKCSNNYERDNYSSEKKYFEKLFKHERFESYISLPNVKVWHGALATLSSTALFGLTDEESLVAVSL